jgi:hypothetical protein
VLEVVLSPVLTALLTSAGDSNLAGERIGWTSVVYLRETKAHEGRGDGGTEEGDCCGINPVAFPQQFSSFIAYVKMATVATITRLVRRR